MATHWSVIHDLCSKLAALAGPAHGCWVEKDGAVVAGTKPGDVPATCSLPVEDGSAEIARACASGEQAERLAGLVASLCSRELGGQRTLRDMAETVASQWRQTNALLRMLESSGLHLKPSAAIEKTLNILSRSTELGSGVVVLRLPGEEVYTAINAQRHEQILDPNAVAAFESINDDVRVLRESETDNGLGTLIKTLRQVAPPVVFARLACDAEFFGFLLLPVPDADAVTSEDLKLLSAAARVLGVAVENYYRLDRERDAVRLKVENELLEQQARDMEELIHVVAHDLRSPMTSMYGFMHVALDEVEDLKACLDTGESEGVSKAPALIAEPLRDGLRSVEKLNRMVQRLLDYSRSSRIDYAFEMVGMKALVEDVVESFKPEVAKRSIEIEIAELPDVGADRAQVEAIYGNLIDNAIKYMGEGEVKRITCGVIQAADPVYFVRDTGKGMTADEAEAAFLPFKRFADDATPGEGIGLAQVRKIVDRHGGRVWCESGKGRGSTFYFTLGRNDIKERPDSPDLIHAHQR